MNSLNECKVNDQFIIKYLEGTKEQKKYLSALGFIPETMIKVINITNDDMIVQVFESKIAINSNISKLIHGTILKKQKSLSKIKQI